MSEFNVVFKLKPLDNPTLPYNATIVVEQLIGNNWVPHYTTNEYLSDFYHIPVVNATDSYRVKVSLNTLGRVTNETSMVINGTTSTIGRRYVQPYDERVSTVLGITNSANSEILRTNMTRLQFDADPEPVNVIISSFFGITGTVNRLNLEIVNQTTDVNIIYSTINRRIPVTITRLNGSSIGS